MPEDMETPEVQGISNNNSESTKQLSMPAAQSKKTVNDWLRDLRMSASVNKTTLGVESERVTPELMMAAANKLLKINRRQAESDSKDSLEFQRVYGPTDYFAEHILRDAGRLGRQLLWKATNKGNLDFMQPGALDQHVSDVFNTSKLTNMVDASSPLESVEASYKVSRLGEGGVGSVDSAPVEMRLVQPSFLGFIDPCRSVECGSEKHMVFTALGWKKIADITTDDMVACLVGGRLEYHHPEQVVSYEYDGELYCFDNGTVAYEVTGNHRMWCRKQPHKERMTKRGWKKAYEPQFEFEYAESMHNTNRIFQTGGHLPLVHGEKTCMIVTSDEDARMFDMNDWCAFLGWYVAEGSIVHTDKYRRAVSISQSTHINPENCEEIARLLHRMCIHYKRTDTRFDISSRTLYNELEPLGYCDDKYIPEEVFEAPEEAQWAFIDALLKGDGEKKKTGLPILHTTSKRLADDYERLMFQLGYAVGRSDRADDRQPQYKHMYRVCALQTTQAWLYKNGHKITEREELSDYYYKEPYKGKVYCLTVPGGLFYTKLEGRHGFWVGNSLRVGLDAYMTKNCMKGSDGKLYQKFIDAKTGKEVLLDSVTAAKSVITTPEMMQAKTSHVYAMGGKTGVRIVKKSDVDYYLPHMDDAFTNAANLVTGLSGVKELRLLMGCLHPLMNVVCVNKRNETSIIPARLVSTETAEIVPGATDKGKALNYHVRTTVAKLPGGRNWFRKVVLYSGRTLVTSKDHRWPVIRDGEVVLVPAEKLRKGDKVPRSTFKDFPNRRMFINKQLVTRDVAVLLGYAARTLQQSDGKLVITYQPRHRERIDKALDKLQIADDAHFYKTTNFRECLAFREGWFHDWLKEHIGVREDERAIPSEVLSADLPTVICFLDAYTADETQVAMDSAECMWILNLPNTQVRDAIAFLLARTRTDTYYRDAYQGDGEWQLALKLVEMKIKWNDCILDEVKAVLVAPNAPIMVDIDVNDNLYATANGIITHNSKYPQQAVSIESREAPYVRNIDEQSGLDMHSRIGKYLGARYARKPGTVTAVRKDRIDMLYDDGTKGSVELYENFPMNAKGYITNTPQVKAGQHVDANGLLASSNYTDDKGVAALGTNLRTGWMSWKGGTYEDAIVISESAAKKLSSTTMYSSDLDLDKTVTLGKNNYIAWKPSEYTKDQMSILDDDGIVRPGTIVRKGDPLVLAVRTSEPSPGTMGKRVLTDLSQTWEHDHPGRITDIVRTRKGVRVLATVTAPAEVGDKLSNGYGAKGVVSQIIPDDEMPADKDGKPLEMLMSPLGLVTRCNPAQLTETLLGKVAHKTGQTQTIPAFYNGNMHDYVMDKLKQNHLSAEDDFFDQETGRKIPDVVNGYSYIYKLKHLAESKETARGTDEYGLDETPAGGGYSGSKRFGYLETGALVSHCLMGYTRVLTRDGYMPISSIVQQRLPVEVVSYNEKTDRFEYIKVTQWFARAVSQEDLWRVTTNARQDGPTSGALRGYHHALRCTKEHKILTPDRGFVQACELKPGDLVYNRGPLMLDWQRRIVIGTIMGDGTLNNYKNKLGESCPNLVVVHGPKQHAYTDWMYRKLKNLCKKEPTVNERAVASSKGFGGSGAVKRMQTVSTYDLQQLEHRFYSMSTGIRKKIVPKGIVEEMGWAGIAVWYMDDGSVQHARKRDKSSALMFHTCGFTIDDCNQLIAELNAFTGLTFSLLLKSGKYPIVYLKHGPRTKPGEKSQCDIFCEAIAPYIVEDFRYKLGTFYPADMPVGQYWADKEAPDYILHGEPCQVIASEPDTNPPEDGYIAYDITVPGNHNFIASGIVVSNSAFDTLLDNKLIRGQNNSDFWRSVRTGGIPTIPGEPLVQKKFFAHLQGAGVNVRKTPKGVSIFALSNQDVSELAGPREVKSRDTYEAKTFRPIDGGLFGQDVFGPNGDKWAYIQLDEPVPNPVMAEPLARLLRMTDKDFVACATGEKEVNGIKGPEQLKKHLSQLDVADEARIAMNEFKNAPASKKDAALKRYVAIENMRRQGVQPSEYMLDKIPVLPPVFRPISSHNGLTMVADANYLYAQLLDARDDLRDARSLPQEYQDKARLNIYKKWNELTGMYDPEDVKLRNKNVGGLLQWALGKGSPKFSAFHRKVLGSSVDTVGRGVIVPDSKLTIDEIGIPVEMALDVMSPFVERKLVNMGYTPIDAMKMVKKRDRTALSVLDEVVKTHPVEMNRAPTLHKFNIMAFKPVLVQGHAIKVNPAVCPGFAADFDGDSILNLIRIGINCEILKEKVEKVGISGLTKLEMAVYLSSVQDNGSCDNQKEDTMIAKDQKCILCTAVGSLSEIPVVPGSEVQKSDTVTEWDVEPGMFSVDTVDPATGERVVADITKVSRHTGLKMLDCSISTRGSFSHIVTASEDHSLITLNPETLQLEKTTPANAAGRLVPRIIQNTGNNWERCERYVYAGKVLPATWELGYAIGAIIGDGWIDANNTLRIACCNESLQEYMLNMFTVANSPIPVERDAKLWAYDSTEDRFSKNKQQRLTIYADKACRTELKKLIGTGAYNKKIPEDSLAASRAHLRGMLSGLLATDGSVNYSEGTKAKKTPCKTVLIHTTSQLLRDGIQELCSRLGIRTSATKYRGAHSLADCYAVNLSLQDLAKEIQRHPTQFLTHHADKDEALRKITLGVENSTSSLDYDIVPFPEALRSEFIFAEVNRIDLTSFTKLLKLGYVSRKYARECVKLLREAPWALFSDPASVAHKFRRHHAAEQAKALVDRWIAIVEDESIAWEHVDSVTPSTCTEGWDCTVPGPYTFTLVTGTVVQDTVNIHVPVSDNARKEAMDRMRPSRNLMSPASRKIMNKPEKEYMQGLYIATRMGESPNGRAQIFRTYEEARDAYRQGLIDVDTPIQILEKQS